MLGDEDEELITASNTLKNAKTIAIFMHINVDCDAMGSSLALKRALEQLGKRVDVFVDSKFPSNFRVFGNLNFVNKRTIKENYDLAVCLDCSTENRLGKYKYFYKKNSNDTLLIDHHVTSLDRYCNFNYVKLSSSTAEILYFVIQNMNVEFDIDICKFLLAGIVTDTGKFTHTTSSKTFEVASKLLSFSKLRMEELSDYLFNSMTFGTFCMIRLAYKKMELFCDNKFALVMFSKDEFADNNSNLYELDVLPDLPLQIESVKFAILASEDDKGYFRISMRSKGEISARAVVESFGGGGHFNASGCKIFGEYEEVRQRLIDSTCKVLDWKL